MRFIEFAEGMRRRGERPYVDGITPGKWYREFEREGRCPGKRCFWEIYHLRYASEHVDRKTLYVRCPGGRTMGSNYRERGLHYGGEGGVADFPLLEEWSDGLVDFRGMREIGLDGRLV